MIVKELEEILHTVKDKNRIVYMSDYCTKEVNGYFYGKQEDEDALLLTNLNVQPRINPEA